MFSILGSQRALFDKVIVEANLNVGNFRITKEKNTPGTTKLIGTGMVTVTYEPSGIARHYRDGVFPPPHVDFARELTLNIFKTR